MSKLDLFLLQKRQFYVPPTPPLEVSKDTYLQSFNVDFIHSTTRRPSIDQETSIPTLQSSIQASSLPNIEIIAKNGESDKSSLLKLKIHNLVYRMTEDELIQFATKLHVKLVKVEMGSDTSPGLPAGTAIAYVSSEETDISEVLSALNGEDCQGRIIRVSEVSTNKSRESFGQTRYFDRDISVKCNNCNEVGHRQFECPNPLLETFCCHLCGGNHDPGDCSSIICFRCNRFGHHSRFCDNSRHQKEAVCTLCGLISHCPSSCLIYQSSEKFRKGGKQLDNEKDITNLDSIICMVCFETGHTSCRNESTEKSSNQGLKRLFCSNCGEANHLVDFPPPGEYNQCRAPFYEAYGRFPELMNLLEDPLHGGLRGRRQHDLYGSLTRYQGDKATQMFPCLQQPIPVMYESRGKDKSSRGGNTYSEGTKYHSEYFDSKRQQGRQVSFSSSSSTSYQGYERHDTCNGSGNSGGNHKRFRNNDNIPDNIDQYPSKRTYFNHQVEDDKRHQGKSDQSKHKGRGFTNSNSSSANGSDYKNSKLLNYSSNRR